MTVRTLRIALVTFEFPPHNATGGIGSYFFHLANLLGSYGHSVFVFSGTNVKLAHNFIQNENYTNYLVLSKDNNEFKNEVVPIFSDFVASNTIDVIESPEVGACAIKIKEKFPEISLIVKMHTPGVLISKIYNSYNPFYKKIRFVLGSFKKGSIDLGYWSKSDKNKHTNDEYLICTKADLLLSPSNALKTWSVQFWGLKAKNIQVLENPFVSISQNAPSKVERQSKTICFIGKLTILKGIIVLTETIKKIATLYPDYKFVIVGRDEPFSTKNISGKSWMISKLGVHASRVEFLGIQNATQVRQIFESSSIALVPSLWENFPTVILEAMAAGCPVVASNRGGIPEMVEHEKTGLLFNATSANDFVKKITSIIENRAWGFELARNAQKKIVSNTHLQNRILNTYENFIRLNVFKK